MFEINATLVIFVVSFLVFIALLKKIMLDPVGKVLELRAEKIRLDLEEGKAARSKAETVLNEYHQHLHDIRVKAQAVINEAVEKANYHRNARIGRVREQGQKKLDEARAALENERTKALDELIQHEMELVGSITEKLLGEKPAVSLDKEKVRGALEEVC